MFDVVIDFLFLVCVVFDLFELLMMYVGIDCFQCVLVVGVFVGDGENFGVDVGCEDFDVIICCVWYY